MTRFVALAAVCACQPWTGAWKASIGGERYKEAEARAIAVTPSGDAAMLWLSREGQATALAVSTYDERGHLTWTRAVSAPGCTAASSGAVAFGRDGAVIVVTSDSSRTPMCVLAL